MRAPAVLLVLLLVAAGAVLGAPAVALFHDVLGALDSVLEGTGA